MSLHHRLERVACSDDTSTLTLSRSEASALASLIEWAKYAVDEIEEYGGDTEGGNSILAAIDEAV